MPDVCNKISELDTAVAGQLGDAMELRAKDPAQQTMRAAYLADLDLPDGAVVAGDRVRYRRDQPRAGDLARRRRGYWRGSLPCLP